MKIGSVEMATDPAEALKEFQSALQSIDALPVAEQGSLPNVRLRAMFLRKQADAFERLGEYSQAEQLFHQALEIHERLASLDPKDLRALFDVVILLNDQAISYDDASQPRLVEKTLVQVVDNMERMVKQEPANDSWNALLAYSQVRIGTIRTKLKMPGPAEQLCRKGLAELRMLAGNDHASATVLDQTADAFLRVEPAALKDPRFALACAEREVAMTHQKTPFRLLTLAQAYRAAGQVDKGKATAVEGLALLPAQPPGSLKPSIRKMLEAEAHIH
jgi:tetratricopeptide (TPR) repeat protein